MYIRPESDLIIMFKSGSRVPRRVPSSLFRQYLLATTNPSAQNIADTLKNMLTTWNVFEKTVCIVTDNASSMVKACEILKIRNLPCFAHTLNLVVQLAPTSQ